jgi:hypothetical protein
VKVIRNGQLLIIKGEKTYNGFGTLVPCLFLLIINTLTLFIP